MTSYTPVEGVTPGAPLRFSRGMPITGVTHAVAGTIDTPTADRIVTTVCGRKLRVMTTYDSTSWPRMHAGPHRTHQTGTCHRCIVKAIPDTPDIAELARYATSSILATRRTWDEDVDEPFTVSEVRDAIRRIMPAGSVPDTHLDAVLTHLDADALAVAP